MNSISNRKLGSALCALSFLLAFSCIVHADGDLPDEVRALLAKERARNFKSAEDKAGKGTTDSKNGAAEKNGPTIHRKGVVGGCDMQVGNSVARPGAMNAKPQPVIITGPVVQVCKK